MASPAAGSVYYVGLRNFMGVRDAGFYPGPGLNVVVGANGTGGNHASRPVAGHLILPPRQVHPDVRGQRRLRGQAGDAQETGAERGKKKILFIFAKWRFLLSQRDMGELVGRDKKGRKSDRGEARVRVKLHKGDGNSKGGGGKCYDIECVIRKSSREPR